MATRTARLLVVATPIGNLGDLSARAAEALALADVVACEDTRRTGRLLAHLGIDAPKLVRLDDHTERDEVEGLLRRIRGGEVVALVSDAGTPGVSDPGARLITAAVDAGIPVEVVPGPVAAIVALVGSGLLDPSGRFCFEGFLPRKGPARAERLAELVGERRTIVLYEAPHRLGRTLADLAATLGEDREVAIARELTKRFEETWRGTLGEAVERAGREAPKGEHVIVLAGAAPAGEVDDDALLEALAAELDAGATRRDATANVARRLGVPANRVKRLLHDAPDPTRRR